MNDSQSQPFAIGQGTEAPAFRKSVRNWKRPGESWVSPRAELICETVWHKRRFNRWETDFLW